MGQRRKPPPPRLSTFKRDRRDLTPAYMLTCSIPDSISYMDVLLS